MTINNTSHLESMAPLLKAQANSSKAMANIHVALAEVIDNSLDAGAKTIKISSVTLTADTSCYREKKKN